MFKTYGDMVSVIHIWTSIIRSPSQIIHLEHGTCSNIDYTDLNKRAAECLDWTYFIDEAFCDELFDYGKTEFDVNPFMCPTCDAVMPTLSCLFQHAESDACAQTLDDGAVGYLTWFLGSRLS
jgi:hypothetical protein